MNGLFAKEYWEVACIKVEMLGSMIMLSDVS